MPLLPQAQEILERYVEGKPDEFVFPILQGEDLSTPTKEHTAIASGNTIANKYLKKIAKRTGITTDLTTHLARHSIAWHLKKSSIDDAHEADLADVLLHLRDRLHLNLPL